MIREEEARLDRARALEGFVVTPQEHTAVAQIFYPRAPLRPGGPFPAITFPAITFSAYDSRPSDAEECSLDYHADTDADADADDPALWFDPFIALDEEDPVRVRTPLWMVGG